MRRAPAVVALSAVGAYGALQILGRRAGSTPHERRVRLPGDELVAQPQLVTNHATTIRARPDVVWAWLSQMGWHLGGYYTPHWVDALLFPENWESLDRLDPNLVRSLRTGDIIPDGPPGTAHYVVAEVEAPLLLVLKSSTHLPPGWGEKYGATMTWTWCFHLTELVEASTRVHLRVRGHTDPWWFTALYGATIIPADYIMATGMLRGLRTRAELDSSPTPSGRDPLKQELYA